ncbi:MAG: SNF2-related protein [Gammaproteobacteria bacterium]|nr:SNF2-related protein [Gammaproteobacteria bacterium]
MPIQYTRDGKQVVFTNANQRVDDWVAGSAARCGALAAFRGFADEHPGTVLFEPDRIIAGQAAIASLSISQARAMSLPDRPPYVLATDTSGVIGSRNFKLTTRWLAGNFPIATQRDGAFLQTGDGTFLIPEPLFSALELADSFESGDHDLPGHWAALSEFRSLLGSVAAGETEQMEMSAFLEGLRIYTGTALSLALRTDGEDVTFDPVLFHPDKVREAREEKRPLTEQDGLLQGPQLHSFQNHARTGFRAFDDAKKSYLLDHNTYLIIDDDLETVLQIVREKQQAEAPERKAFATNPRAGIAERIQKEKEIGEEESEALAEVLLVETPEYADRAIGIGLWKKPEFAFFTPQPEVWLPETFSLNLGGVWVRLDRNTVAELRGKVDDAIEAGHTLVEYGGQQIPVTDEVRQKLAEVIGVEQPQDRPETGSGRKKQETQDSIVVQVHENFVEENWPPEIPTREIRTPTDQAPRVRTQLLSHQKEALQWQIEAWRSGLPGILNADDQGLGKTLQTLAFLAWLQADMDQTRLSRRKPFLIVAPRGLLRTWESEVSHHLTGIGLGARVRVYGPDLKARRIPHVAGLDTDDGRPRLDFKDIQSAIRKGNGHKFWLLTTYETLSNYQHSFRQISFSVIVFDEIQKIKNAQTRIALAARSVKGDFRIGLTGTPIENQVADLWAIMDAVAPRSLGTLKDFAERYRQITPHGMEELHARLFRDRRNGNRSYPPVAQRNLKENEITGLPRKDYRLYPSTMPDIQATVYEKAREHLAAGEQGAALKMLHHLRSVSLHPHPPETAEMDMEDYFTCSARFAGMHDILIRIQELGERVLIFTEHRQMQQFLAQWLRSEFQLGKVPIVNGATSISKRQSYVLGFQEHLKNDCGFRVMILSPRVAGVGLTLTAATHVIHLSRWWNSAVEEQCNDRIYRIGQKKDVTVHLPLAVHPIHRERSFDCVLNKLMKRKSSLAHAALWPPSNKDYDISELMAGLSGGESTDPSEIDNLDWARFEDWVMTRARDSGDWEVAGTPASGDGGADAVLRHRRRRHDAALVQVKHTENRQRILDRSAIFEIMHARGRYDVSNPQLAVVTNAQGFTLAAQHLAREKSVALVDRDRLGLWPAHVLA